MYKVSYASLLENVTIAQTALMQAYPGSALTSYGQCIYACFRLPDNLFISVTIK